MLISSSYPHLRINCILINFTHNEGQGFEKRGVGKIWGKCKTTIHFPNLRHYKFFSSEYHISSFEFMYFIIVGIIFEFLEHQNCCQKNGLLRPFKHRGYKKVSKIRSPTTAMSNPPLQFILINDFCKN